MTDRKLSLINSSTFFNKVFNKLQEKKLIYLNFGIYIGTITYT